MIAMAIANAPKLLIADEPTTALDVTVQAQILELLRDLLRETGMGLLMITHDLGVVADIADRAVVMKDGRIVEAGAVRDVFRSPRAPLHPAPPECHPGAERDPTAPAAGRSAAAPRGARTGQALPAPARAVRPSRRRAGQGRGRAQPGAAARRDPGHRRRVGLRQVDARAHDPASRGADLRAGQLRRQGPVHPGRCRPCCNSAGACRSCSRTPSPP